MRNKPQNPLEALDPATIQTYSPDRQIDIAQQQIARRPALPGLPPTDALVFTGFDARPIAGQDFISTNLATQTASESQVTGYFFNYVVPDGSRGILRGFKYEFRPGIIITDDINPDIVSRLTVGGPAYTNDSVPGVGGFNVDGFIDMRLGPSIPQLIDTYVIGDAGQVFSLIVNIPLASVALGEFLLDEDIQMFVTFYGNLLISTGVALNFQPGTNPQQLANVGGLKSNV
jgi:hypothetical protein